MQAVTNISASFSFVLLQIRLTREVMTQWTGTSELTNADKANAQEPTRQTTLKWRQLTRPVSPAQYRLLPSAAEYSWHNLTHRSKSHSANEQCWKKQNWFVDPPNPLLCSILPPYTVGHKPSRNWECSTVCFFVFPKLGLYAPIKAQIPLIPIACWFGLSAVWVFPGQKDREKETEKKIRPDITVMCHIILQGTGCFSRFLFSTFNALLVTAVQRAALWLQHTKPSHSRKCSVTENWHVSLLETILKISSQNFSVLNLSC